MRPRDGLLGALALLAPVLLEGPAPRGAELTGSVTAAESGRPIEGATVTLSSVRGADLRTTIADTAGRYAFGGLGPGGTFFVRATAAGRQPRYHGGDRERGSAVTVGGAAPVVADIALPRAAELMGMVWRPDGTVLHPGYVWLIRSGSPPRYFNAPIGQDGSYHADGLPEGTYRVRALTYDPVAQQLTSPDWDWPEPVTLAGGDTLYLDMHLEGEQAEPNWIGLVEDERGRPLPGVQLMILRVVREEDASEGTQHVSVRRSNAHGRCELDQLAPGRYRVSTTDVPPPYAPWRNLEPEARGADQYSLHFEIAAAEAEEAGPALTVMRLSPGRTLKVSVRDLSGAPADDAVSLVLWHSGDAPFGGDGSFARPERAGPGALEVRGLLPAATYELRLGDRDDRGRWCVEGLNGAPHRVVSVPAAGDPHPVEIVVRPCAGVPSA